MKKYFLKFKYYILGEFALNIVSTIALSSIPYLQKLLIDRAFLNHDLHYFIKLSVYFTLIIGVYFLSTWGANTFLIIRLNNMKGLMTKDLFKAIVSLKHEEFSKRDVGEYMSMQSNDINIITGDYIEPFLNLIENIINISIYAVSICIYINVGISALIFFISILICLVPKIMEKKLSAARKEQIDAMGRYTSNTKDYLDGFKLININTRKNINERHVNDVHQVVDAIKRADSLEVFSSLLYGLATKILDIIVFIVSILLVVKGKMELGSVIAILTYVTCYSGLFEDFLYDVSIINSSKNVRDGFLSYVNAPEHTENTDKEHFEKEICISNVSLKYEHFQINNLNYVFKKGMKYAIVGHSGAGKSTLVNILMKYVKIDSGSITIDGENINDIDTDKIMGFIGQKNHIYKSNFKNNTTVFGAYDGEKVNECISNLENSNILLDNIMLSEDCNELSGGEKQLISFIRNIAGSYEILIMDEPFAALDRDSLSKIMRVLSELNNTIIMITHDISDNLKYFDYVLQLENGSIVENNGLFNK